MKCMFCENEATIFLTQIEGSELKKISLCSKCASNIELMESKGLLHAMSDNMIPTDETSETTSASSSISCICGFTLDDLTHTGRLGCSLCYEAFSDILNERIKTLHKGESHTGKQLDVPETKYSIEKQMSEINLALRTAIKEEEFEKAASLKDQISSLEKKLSEL